MSVIFVQADLVVLSVVCVYKACDVALLFVFALRFWDRPHRGVMEISLFNSTIICGVVFFFLL